MTSPMPTWASDSVPNESDSTSSTPGSPAPHDHVEVTDHHRLHLVPPPDTDPAGNRRDDGMDHEPVVPPAAPRRPGGRRRPQAHPSPSHRVEPAGPWPAPTLRYQPTERDFWLMDDSGFVDPRHRRRARDEHGY